MFALLRPLLISLLVIVGLSYALGIIKYEKPDYGCFHGRKLHFADKTRIFALGNLNIYAYPLVADCAEEDRYNPDKIYQCAYQEYCQRDSQ